MAQVEIQKTETRANDPNDITMLEAENQQMRFAMSEAIHKMWAMEKRAWPLRIAMTFVVFAVGMITGAIVVGVLR